MRVSEVFSTTGREATNLVESMKQQVKVTTTTTVESESDDNWSVVPVKTNSVQVRWTPVEIFLRITFTVSLTQIRLNARKCVFTVCSDVLSPTGTDLTGALN